MSAKSLTQTQRLVSIFALLKVIETSTALNAIKGDYLYASASEHAIVTTVMVFDDVKLRRPTLWSV
jgi:hypothetical protein